MTSLPNPFSNSGATPSGGPDEAAALTRSHAPGAAAEIDEHRFVLNEEKFLFDIGCVPDDFAKYMAMMEGLVDHDEPPLFIQEQKRA